MILSKVIKYGKEHYKFLNMTILTKKQNAHHVEYYIGKVCCLLYTSDAADE